ncbi:MAG: 3-oxo-tetronate kinase [Planctomycetota bacterium]
MKTPLLGCIADDFTGATDLASMLVRAGLNVIQCFGLPDDPESLRDADAVVISLKSRSIASEDAVDVSRAALRVLQELGVQRYFFKYCSTFDSTPSGNIGPVADALANDLGNETTLFCPSFPENGRTVYCGHLFVHGIVLHESGMRNHPLNPMTDGNLVRVLQAQSEREVTSWKLHDPPPNQTRQHVIVDAITDEDLNRVATAAKEHHFLTGGSAIAGHWGRILFEETRGDSERDASSAPLGGGRTVILAGSCSDATRTQIGAFATRYPVHRFNATTDSNADELASRALDWCRDQWAQTSEVPLLICSGEDAQSVKRAQQAMGVDASSRQIEHAFAAIARGLMDFRVQRIVVAGGETSGAVTSAIHIRVVRIGSEIAPGVPWITSIHPPHLTLALKSGNFGGPRFFLEVTEAPDE